MKISISTDGREAPATLRAKIAAGEQAGAAALWCANHLFQRDAIVQGAIALGASSRLSLTLMAINPYTLHPVQAVMAAATLDEWFPGRVTLCFGVGAPADLRSVAIETPKPVRTMRETFEIARALLAGETVRHDGEVFKIQQRGLVQGARQVPLILAASGPQMLELAGAVADGVLLSAGTSVEFVRWSLEQVQRGAKGRQVKACAVVYGSIDDNETVAHDRLRRTLALLLRGAHHSQNLALGGSVLDQPRLDAALLANDWPQVQSLITDDIVSRHAASGRPGLVAERLAAYQAAGLNEIVLAGVREPEQISRVIAAARPAIS